MGLSMRDCYNHDYLCDFGKPVESIMRCDDFKSNFARRLSNRYIARSSAVTLKPNLSLKPVQKKPEEIPQNNRKPAEMQTRACDGTRTGGSRQAMDDSYEKDLMFIKLKETEITSLNREIEMLKWQLAQTEANRQMQMALLNQLVKFLDRVKEKMEGNKNDKKKSPQHLSSSFNAADLPRSASAMDIHNLLKSNAREISKSIGNFNGFTECQVLPYNENICLNYLRNQSKLRNKQGTEYVIHEEIARLINLANSVIGTKLPDTSCNCDEPKSEADNSKVLNNNGNREPDVSMEDLTAKKNDKTTFDGRLELIKEAFSARFDKYESEEYTKKLEGIIAELSIPSSDYNEYKAAENMNKNAQDYTVSANGDNEVYRHETAKNMPNAVKNTTDVTDKAGYAHDESGFSSMTSFQDIGIPIINVSPPTPERNTEAQDNKATPAVDFNLLEEMDMWGAQDLDHELAMNVFWV